MLWKPTKIILGLIILLLLVFAPVPVASANSFKPKSTDSIRGAANQNGSRGFPSIDSHLLAPSRCPNVKLLVPIYKQAGQMFDVPGNVLAGINKIETNMGCNLNVSSAGAEGWMQFMPSTWASYGMDADGDGKADPNNAVDAIFSAARYLDASGASKNLYNAILSYNHADWYVKEVLQAAQDFQGINGVASASIAVVEAKLAKLQKRIGSAEKQVVVARHQLKNLTTRLHTFQERYAQASKELVLTRDGLSELETRSNDLIKQYADIAYYSNIGQSSSENNQELLSYIGDSNTPQEAMTTYTTAKVLMENRQGLLEKIQGTAKVTRLKRNKSANVAAAREALILQEKLDIKNKKKSVQALQIAQKVLSTEYRSVLSKESSYSGSLSIMLDGKFKVNVGGVRGRIVAAAEGELGFGEVPPGSNGGPYVQKYGCSDGEKWCACFASWVWRSAGVDMPFTKNAFDPGRWGASKGLWHPAGSNYNPLPGDLVEFTYGHIGVVEGVAGKNTVSIDGNYGDAVTRHLDTSVLGYVEVPKS